MEKHEKNSYLCDMKRLFLIGYMGSGKTTLGRALSTATGLAFVDLDWAIEQRYHKTIPQIFAEVGESGFREIEQRMLHEVGEYEDTIISCGGGTPCHFDNMAYMNEHGLTVWLDASEEALFRRLRVARQQRPIIKDKDDEELKSFITEALGQREPYYSQATIRFRADELEDRHQIKESIAALRKQISNI